MDISQNGFEMDEKKTSVITTWECPTSVQSVREFISFVNFYQRWILGFSDITCPLHNLFQKNQAWQWTENEQATFKTLKWQVSQALVLVDADPNCQFCMETDALNYAYSTVLLQKQSDGWHHPIDFMSKSMNPAEQNYGIPEREAHAIMKGLQNWQHWLE